MARKKRETMLQRQRRLLKEQRARKAQRIEATNKASRTLPSRGNTSGNSNKARADRRGTAKRVAGEQQRVISRGMEQYVRRQNARDKAATAAKGTKGTKVQTGTRTRGGDITPSPKGRMTKNKSSMVKSPSGSATSRRRTGQGGRTSRGGRLGNTTDAKFQTVDVKGTRIPDKALPRGNKGGSMIQRGGLPPKLAKILEKGIQNRTGKGGKGGKGQGRMGLASSLLATGITEGLRPGVDAIGKKLGKGLKNVLTKKESNSSQSSRGSRYRSGNKPTNKPTKPNSAKLAKVNQIPPSEGIRNNPDYAIPPNPKTWKSKPKPKPSSSSGSKGSKSSSSSSGSLRTTTRPTTRTPVHSKPMYDPFTKEGKSSSTKTKAAKKSGGVNPSAPYKYKGKKSDRLNKALSELKVRDYKKKKK